MNLQYHQYVRQLRGNRDRNWRQPNPHPRVWFRGPVGELPPVSWGGGHDREDLVQDRLHAQNRTWSDDSSFYTASSEGSHHSFISLSDDDGGEVDLGEESLLELLEHAEAPEPVEPVHRGPRGRASFPPGSRLGRGRGPTQPRPTRRSDWWGAPSVPLYTSVYTRPRSTAWWDSLATRQPMILRSIPVREDREPDLRVDRTVGTSSPLETAGDNTDRVHSTGCPVSTTSRAPGCQLGSNRTRPCHSVQEAEARCRPRPVPVWEEEDLVVTEGPRAPLLFWLQHSRW